MILNIKKIQRGSTAGTDANIKYVNSLLLLLLTIFIQDTHVTEVIFSGVLHIYLT